MRNWKNKEKGVKGKEWGRWKEVKERGGGRDEVKEREGGGDEKEE